MPSLALPRRHALVTGIALLALGLCAAATVPPAAVARAQDDRACELLTPELLFEVLGAEVEDWERGTFDEPSYWACNYSWVTEGAVSQVTFAISKVGDQNPADVYDASTRALTESGEHEELDDLGDRAVWIPGVPQLSIQDGGNVLHLSVVHPSDEDGLDVSRRLAAELLSRME